MELQNPKISFIGEENKERERKDKKLKEGASIKHQRCLEGYEVQIHYVIFIKLRFHYVWNYAPNFKRWIGYASVCPSSYIFFSNMMLDMFPPDM
jgi:hypothetical protein